MRKPVAVVLDYLLRTRHVPISQYDNGKFVRCIGQQVVNEKEQTVIRQLVPHATGQCPQLERWSDGRSLALVRKEHVIYVLGPVLVATPEMVEAHVQSCSWDDWLEGLCLLQNILDGSNLRPSDLYMKNGISHGEQKMNAVETVRRFNQNQEHAFIHNPYDQELRELNSVATGDIAGLQASLHESFDGHFAQLGPTRLRSLKNLGIVDLALLARAAIRGGLDYEQSFTINDQYINSLEAARTEQDVMALGLQAKQEYTQVVHDIQNKTTADMNRIIRKCQTYVQTHLHEALTLQTVSVHCQVTPQYLSRLFRHSQRLRFSEYVQREKLNASKRDLIYTQHAISTIAFDYGYSSASHYADVFKRYVGMTPSAFRNVNGKM
ncbi:helix-turn-helix transcriptional regulator [Levilactobacillus fujinensis]|uniref:Helix-turn-helix transcriptional regulator n=1 Tax=Levilactobacillus fujinensis TaxID=2486024 RepID=A0ABW1THB2_9LACO|nr:AraC family transcriptional regulator [Levilactobacillus fujinensis]